MIPDPVELMEARMEREMDKVDAAGTYPCLYCERRFELETMVPVSEDPSTPLECGRDDCHAGPKVRCYRCHTEYDDQPLRCVVPNCGGVVFEPLPSGGSGNGS